MGMFKQYKCKHFSIEELVSKSMFKRKGDLCWLFLDERALITIDALREKFGAITINDWLWDGRFKESGLRDKWCTYYSPFSQHSFGRAFDLKFVSTTPEKVQEYILANPEEFPYITRIEDARVTKTWLHFDVGNYGGGERPYVFKP